MPVEVVVSGQRDDVVIVGGGIGGLAAALAVARAGLGVRVLERAAEIHEVGAGIQLGPNATRILDGWDLLGEITAIGVLPRRLALRDAVSGGPLAELDLGEPFRRHYGAPYVVCHRNDLLVALANACRRHPRIAIETDRCVSAVQPGPDSVAVHCRDGSRFEAAAVIGADGLMSVVRRLLSEDVPVSPGYVAYRGAIPLRSATRPWALDEVVAWIGPGMHFVQYALHESDLYNQVAVFRSEEAASGGPDWGTPEELDRRFGIACEPVREALRAINRDQRWYMADREPLTAWTQGRVTLLGDAAHPMLQYLAQGACQALEDAAALGAAVAACTAGGDQPDGLPKALLAYQDARIAPATRVQRNARLWGDIWHTSDPLALTLRNALFRSLRADDYRFTDWVYQPADARPAAGQP